MFKVYKKLFAYVPERKYLVYVSILSAGAGAAERGVCGVCPGNPGSEDLQRGRQII